MCLSCFVINIDPYLLLCDKNCLSSWLSVKDQSKSLKTLSCFRRIVRINSTFFFNKNKAFVGLGSCDNVQTEWSIFEYANWFEYA